MELGELDRKRSDSYLADSKPDAAEGIPTEHAHQNPRQTHWALTGLMTVGMIMGTGVLALPAAVAGLGYVLGILFCLLFGILAGYLGIILGETRLRFCPNVTSYAELSYRLVSEKFGNFTRYAMYLNWWSILPLYMLTTIESFRAAFYWTNICYSVWGLLAMGLLIVPIQMRSYHSISYIVAISDISVIVIIVLILIVLGAEGQNTPSGFKHSVGPPTGSFLSRYGNISTIIFAYQGQSVFLEMMSEMKDKREWPKALWLGQSVMVPTYILTAAIGYYLLGDTVPAFLPAALPNNGAKVFINLLLAFHVLVAYLVHNQPLSQAIEAIIDPKIKASRFVHFVVSSSILLSAYIVANLIPFFEQLVGIIGAAFGSPILLMYPPLFYLLGMKSAGEHIPKTHLIICGLCLFVLFPFTFFVGVASAFESLAEKWSRHRPFDCDLS